MRSQFSSGIRDEWASKWKVLILHTDKTEPASKQVSKHMTNKCLLVQSSARVRSAMAIRQWEKTKRTSMSGMLGAYDAAADRTIFRANSICKWKAYMSITSPPDPSTRSLFMFNCHLLDPNPKKGHTSTSNGVCSLEIRLAFGISIESLAAWSECGIKGSLLPLLMVRCCHLWLE